MAERWEIMPRATPGVPDITVSGSLYIKCIAEHVCNRVLQGKTFVLLLLPLLLLQQDKVLTPTY